MSQVELDLSPTQGKARVWLAERPCAAYCQSYTIERVFSAKGLGHRGVKCCGIELFIHVGGYCPYALLGGEFTSEDSSILRIKVAVSENGGDPFTQNLSRGIDQVWTGLPADYSEAVIEGAAKVGANHILGAGTLVFDRAAHGSIGSSRSIFSRVSGAVVRLLGTEPLALSNEGLIALL
jgi:hypothetical protein